MSEPHTHRFLIVEADEKYAQWLRHSVDAGWPADSIVVMDWHSFGRVRTAMTVRDFEIVVLSLAFDEGIEEPTTDGFDWIRKLRSQPGFPEMIVLAEGGSELSAVRALRLGAADYMPKRLLTPARLQRSIKLTLRGMEREAQRRAERTTGKAPTAVQGPAHGPNGAQMPAHVATHTGASLAQAAHAALSSPASTQTGAVLERAAREALAKPIAAATPPEVPPQPHVATHTGASLALAAQAAIATPAPASAAIPTPADTQASSEPAPPAIVTAPVAREVKPVAPENHQIPGYTILQKIGESEAAAVYLAIAEDLGHNVALKVSKRKHSGDSNDTGQRSIMFQREFEAIAALDHPSIIDLFDYGIHDGVEFLAMEYFPCGDLKARLQNPLTAEEAIAFVREIASSLKVVHEAGIIHRDLKPPNVMLRDDGSVVLIDFGLARSLLCGDGSTRTGVLRGSPYYMSPEQAQGEALDVRTDLYSLGVILYEMLAGRKPYLGASAIDVLQQHVMAPVPELPVHHLFYQPILERLMSKSREHRIASCDELLAALAQMAASGGNGEIVDPAALVAAAAGG